MTTTNSRVRQAYRDHPIIRILDADPPASSLDGGEVWYRSDTNEWRGYDGSSFVTIDFTADA